jgi:hypothetical protein
VLAKTFAPLHLVRTWDEPVNRPLNIQYDDDPILLLFPATQPLPAELLRELVPVPREHLPIITLARRLFPHRSHWPISSN